MKRHGARSALQAALPSLLCAATAACAAVGTFGAGGAGGVYMILAFRPGPAAAEQDVRRTAQVIETRCDSLGVRCKVERHGGEGSNRLKLSVSGARDVGRVKGVLLAEGRLELRPVVSPPHPAPMEVYPTREAAAAAAGSRHDVVPFEDGVESAFLVVEREPVVAGPDLRGATAAPAGDPRDDNYVIAFTLRPDGAYRFGGWTRANTGRYVAIVWNGAARSAPYIRGQITDSGQINGNFDRRQAEDIALILRSGHLPAPLEVVEEGAY